MAEISWEKFEDGALCSSPVRVGSGKEESIVAAAHHRGGFIPGMYTPESGICQIPWGCNAIDKSEFYLLSLPASSYLWTRASNGKVPENAFKAGVSELGESLYVGRFKRKGKMLLGKVHPSHKVCYVPFEDTEQCNKNYEVLCLKNGKGMNTGLIPSFGGFPFLQPTMGPGMINPQHLMHNLSTTQYYPLFPISSRTTSNYNQGNQNTNNGNMVSTNSTPVLRRGTRKKRRPLWLKNFV